MKKTIVIAISLAISLLMMSNASARVVVTTIPQRWQLVLMETALTRVDSQYQSSILATEMNQKCKVEESLAGNIDEVRTLASRTQQATGEIQKSAA